MQFFFGMNIILAKEINIMDSKILYSLFQCTVLFDVCEETSLVVNHMPAGTLSFLKTYVMLCMYVCVRAILKVQSTLFV